MKHLILCTIMLFLFIAPAHAQFTNTASFHFLNDNNVEPTIENANGYINTATGYGSYINTWFEVDVTPYGVPSDAKAIFVIGRLLITGGNDTSQEPAMTVLFAKPSSTVSTSKYQIQAYSNNAKKGVRDNFSTIIPLENGKYKYLWNTPNNPDPWTHQWPAYASYGMSLTIQGYFK